MRFLGSFLSFVIVVFRYFFYLLKAMFFFFFVLESVLRTFLPEPLKMNRLRAVAV